MQRTHVTSRNCASIGYDASTDMLEVEFHRGGVYRYYGVPQSTYEGLMAAPSIGGYLDAQIKKGGYRYEKL